jgi:D-alanyl-D-alanine endopeptidase (penicillin-binding protein 7)
MLNFIIGLIIISQLVVPFEGMVLGVNTLDQDYPKRKMTGSFEPIIEANSALALDMKTAKILFQRNGFERRPIASITKLMTALVFLEASPDWNKNVTIAQDDKVNGGRLVFKLGEIVNLRDLFRVALIGSVNSAAEALARATDMSYDEFIDRMNSKAQELGMTEAVFVEPTGIQPNNRATAMNVALLLRAALEEELIREVLTTDKYSFTSVTGKRYVIENTNKLLDSYLDIVGGKTGYIDEAGFCLVNFVKSPVAPEGIIVVILGAKTEEDRFQQNKFLSQWVFDNWEWEEG